MAALGAAAVVEGVVVLLLPAARPAHALVAVARYLGRSLMAACFLVFSLMTFVERLKKDLGCYLWEHHGDLGDCGCL